MGRKGNNGAEIGSVIPFLSAHPARLTFFVFGTHSLNKQRLSLCRPVGSEFKGQRRKEKKRLRISRKQIRVLCRRVCAMNRSPLLTSG